MTPDDYTLVLARAWQGIAAARNAWPMDVRFRGGRLFYVTAVDVVTVADNIGAPWVRFGFKDASTNSVKVRFDLRTPADLPLKGFVVPSALGKHALPSVQLRVVRRLQIVEEWIRRAVIAAIKHEEHQRSLPKQRRAARVLDALVSEAKLSTVVDSVSPRMSASPWGAGMASSSSYVASQCPTCGAPAVPALPSSGKKWSCPVLRCGQPAW